MEMANAIYLFLDWLIQSQIKVGFNTDITVEVQAKQAANDRSNPGEVPGETPTPSQ